MSFGAYHAGGIKVKNAISIDGIPVGGTTPSTGTFTALTSNVLSVTTGATIGGVVSLTNATPATATNVGALILTGGLAANAGLYVAGTSTFTGAVSAATLTVASATAFPLIINNNAGVSASAISQQWQINGATKMSISWDSSNGITVYDTKNGFAWLKQGSTTLESVFTAHNTIEDGLSGCTFGNINASVMSFGNHSSPSTMNLDGTVNVLSTATLACAAPATFSGAVVVSNTTDASSTTAASVTLAGGMGIAKQLFVGSTMSASALSITGGGSIAGSGNVALLIGNGASPSTTSIRGVFKVGMDDPAAGCAIYIGANTQTSTVKNINIGTNSTIASSLNLSGNINVLGTLGTAIVQSGQRGIWSPLAVDATSYYASMLGNSLLYTASADIGFSLVTNGAVTVAGGSNYMPGDVVSVPLVNTGVSPTITVNTTGSGGSIATFTITTYGGLTTTPANPVSVTTVTGTGSGATFNLTWGGSVATANIVAAGSGYVVGDVVTLSGGAFSTAATVLVSAVTSLPSIGTVVAVNVLTGGQYQTLPINPASVSGGTGTGLTLTLTWGAATPFTILSNGTTAGYSATIYDPSDVRICASSQGIGNAYQITKAAMYASTIAIFGTQGSTITGSVTVGGLLTASSGISSSGPITCSSFTSTGNVTFANLIDSGLTASSLVWGNASKQLASVVLGPSSNGASLSFSAGTLSVTNQQDISTTASPSFSAASLTNSLTFANHISDSIVTLWTGYSMGIQSNAMLWTVPSPGQYNWYQGGSTGSLFMNLNGSGPATSCVGYLGAGNGYFNGTLQSAALTASTLLASNASKQLQSVTLTNANGCNFSFAGSTLTASMTQDLSTSGNPSFQSMTSNGLITCGSLTASGTITGSSLQVSNSATITAGLTVGGVLTINTTIAGGQLIVNNSAGGNPIIQLRSSNAGQANFGYGSNGAVGISLQNLVAGKPWLYDAGSNSVHTYYNTLDNGTNGAATFVSTLTANVLNVTGAAMISNGLTINGSTVLTIPYNGYPALSVNVCPFNTAGANAGYYGWYGSFIGSGFAYNASLDSGASTSAAPFQYAGNGGGLGFSAMSVGWQTLGFYAGNMGSSTASSALYPMTTATFLSKKQMTITDGVVNVNNLLTAGNANVTGSVTVGNTLYVGNISSTGDLTINGTDAFPLTINSNNSGNVTAVFKAAGTTVGNIKWTSLHGFSILNGNGNAILYQASASTTDASLLSAWNTLDNGTNGAATFVSTLTANALNVTGAATIGNGLTVTGSTVLTIPYSAKSAMAVNVCTFNGAGNAALYNNYGTFMGTAFAYNASLDSGSTTTASPFQYGGDGTNLGFSAMSLGWRTIGFYAGNMGSSTASPAMYPMTTATFMSKQQMTITDGVVYINNWLSAGNAVMSGSITTNVLTVTNAATIGNGLQITSGTLALSSGDAYIISPDGNNVILRRTSYTNSYATTINFSDNSGATNGLHWQMGQAMGGGLTTDWYLYQEGTGGGAALQFSGGPTWAGTWGGTLFVNGTTDSTSTTTGTITTAGGLGVSKNANIGGILTINTTISGGQLIVNNSAGGNPIIQLRSSNANQANFGYGNNGAVGISLVNLVAGKLWLYDAGSNSVQTYYNTLDDGQGYMVATCTGYGSRGNAGLTVNVASGGSGAYIQVQYAGSGKVAYGYSTSGIDIYDYVHQQSWLTQVGGGAGYIKTAHGTLLDDGSGSMVINGNSQTPLLVNGTSTFSDSTIQLQVSGSAKVNFGTSLANSIYLYNFQFGGKMWLYDATNNNSVYSYYNTLDNGSGSATIAATLTASQYTQSKNNTGLWAPLVYDAQNYYASFLGNSIQYNPLQDIGTTVVSNGLTVTTGGANYTLGQQLYVSYLYGGTPPVFQVTSTNSGAITGLSVYSYGGGVGIPPNPVLLKSVGAQGGSGAYVTLNWGGNVNSATTVSGGTGYAVGNIVQVQGGTASTASTILVTSTGTGGVVTGLMVLVSGQYQTWPNNPVSFTGGAGTGLTANLVWGAATPFTVQGDGSGNGASAIMMNWNTVQICPIANVSTQGYQITKAALYAASAATFSATQTTLYPYLQVNGSGGSQQVQLCLSSPGAGAAALLLANNNGATWKGIIGYNTSGGHFWYDSANGTRWIGQDNGRAGSLVLTSGTGAPGTDPILSLRRGDGYGQNYITRIRLADDNPSAKYWEIGNDASGNKGLDLYFYQQGSGGQGRCLFFNGTTGGMYSKMNCLDDGLAGAATFGGVITGNSNIIAGNGLFARNYVVAGYASGFYWNDGSGSGGANYFNITSSTSGGLTFTDQVTHITPLTISPTGLVSASSLACTATQGSQLMFGSGNGVNPTLACNVYTFSGAAMAGDYDFYGNFFGVGLNYNRSADTSTTAQPFQYAGDGSNLGYSALSLGWRHISFFCGQPATGSPGWNSLSHSSFMNSKVMDVSPTSVFIALSTNAISTTSGALQVAGGAGIQGSLCVGGSVTFGATVSASYSVAGAGFFLNQLVSGNANYIRYNNAIGRSAYVGMDDTYGLAGVDASALMLSTDSAGNKNIYLNPGNSTTPMVSASTQGVAIQGFLQSNTSRMSKVQSSLSATTYNLAGNGTDIENWVLPSSLGGSATVLLPRAANASGQSLQFTFMNSNSSQTLTVGTQGADSLYNAGSGSSGSIGVGPHHAITVRSDGISNWFWW